MNAQYGWICPRCEAVHAPTTLRCHCRLPAPAYETSLCINVPDDGPRMTVQPFCPTEVGRMFESMETRT